MNNTNKYKVDDSYERIWFNSDFQKLGTTRLN